MPQRQNNRGSEGCALFRQSSFKQGSRLDLFGCRSYTSVVVSSTQGSKTILELHNWKHPIKALSELTTSTRFVWCSAMMRTARRIPSDSKHHAVSVRSNTFWERFCVSADGAVTGADN